MTTTFEDFLNELHELEKKHAPIKGVCDFCAQKTIDPEATECINCKQENYGE